MQNQSNNGVKGKEAETAKEKRPDQPTKKKRVKRKYTKQQQRHYEIY